MLDMGLEVEKHHHEVAPSQHELGFVYSTLVKTADNMQVYKYVVHNVAHQYGKTATFMPKPIFGDNGSGMHTHQSLWKEGTPLMADKSGYAGLSQLARAYVGASVSNVASPLRMPSSKMATTAGQSRRDMAVLGGSFVPSV